MLTPSATASRMRFTSNGASNSKFEVVSSPFVMRQICGRPGLFTWPVFFPAEHRDTLIKVRCFPKSDEDVEHAEAGHRPAKPVRSDGPLENGKARAVRNEDKQKVLAPIPEQCVPGRKDEIEPEQQGENYEKNDG